MCVKGESMDKSSFSVLWWLGLVSQSMLCLKALSLLHSGSALLLDVVIKMVKS